MIAGADPFQGRDTDVRAGDQVHRQVIEQLLDEFGAADSFGRRNQEPRFRRSGQKKVPPVGFEPTHPAPEAGALSPELWGLTASERLPVPLPGSDMQICHRHRAAKHGSLARVTQGLGRVLVVDDDEVIRQLIAVNLTLEGFDVATAIDGQDCLDKVQAIAPDVITLDVMMPRLDGWETAIQLRKSPETAHIRVVLITARAQEDDVARGANVGADAYLTKPFDPGEMIRVVRDLAGAPPSPMS
jgi:CheY-like chemotaxis protein